MNTRRRQIYEPDPTPGYDPLEGEESEFGNNHLPRVIVAALLGLAGLAITVWFGYERGIDRSSGEMIVVGPPPGPVRTRPDLPGGAVQPYAGLKVYEPPQAPEAEAENSRLSPASSDETGLAAANPTSGVQPEPQRTQDTATAPQSPEYVQIGAYPSQELAEKAFRQFRAGHGDLAGALLPDIKKADLGGKGIWYRLRIGPFPGKDAATTVCEKMRSEGMTCLLAAR